MVETLPAAHRSRIATFPFVKEVRSEIQPPPVAFSRDLTVPPKFLDPSSSMRKRGDIRGTRKQAGRRQGALHRVALTVEEGGDDSVDGMPHHGKELALPPGIVQRLSGNTRVHADAKTARRIREKTVCGDR